MHFFCTLTLKKKKKKETTMQLLTYIDDVPLFVVRNMKFLQTIILITSVDKKENYKKNRAKLNHGII